MGWLTRIVVTASLWLVPLSVQAQTSGKKTYTRIPFDGDLQQILAEHLAQTKGLIELQQLFEKFKFDPKLLGNMDLNDPKLRAQLQDPKVRAQIEKLLESSKSGDKLDAKQLEALARMFASGPKSDTKKKPDAKAPPKPPGPAVKPPPKSGQATSAPRAAESDGAAKWAQDMFQHLENTPLGDSLRRSPAWQKTMQDMGAWFTDQETGQFRFSTEALENLMSGWRSEGGWKFSLPELGGSKLPMSLPSLPRPDISWGAGGGGWAPPVPPLSSGGSGSMGSSAAGGGLVFAQVLLWGVFIGVVAFVLWRWLGRWQWLVGRQAASLAQLGGWPVDPAKVSSRAEVVQAFEYLSLLRLGPEARSSHHRDIAAGLGGEPERRRDAEELAELYEQARYTPDADPFADADLARARRFLCHFAGGQHA